VQSQEFLIFRLTHASQEEVYSWLEDNKPKDVKSKFSSDREQLESALLSRDKPLVNLGLALFGFEKETGLEIYKKSGELLKKAVLSGTTIGSSIGDKWIVNEGILDELLVSKNSDLLSGLFSNPFVDNDLLVNLYEKNEYFEKLDYDFWFELIAHTLSNPRLSTPYSETWMNPWAEYSYRGIFSAGWKLFEKLPVNKKSAVLLSRLAETIVQDKLHDMALYDVIKRWKVDDTDKYVDYYALCRKALANFIDDFKPEFQKLKESEDVALRQSYYHRFAPEQKEEVRELFEKDNEKFLEEAIENINLYKKESIRDELRKCCWDYKDPYHDLLYPNTFNSRVEQFSKKHPEWFKDFGGEVPFDLIEDPIERINKQLAYVNQKITTISEKLFESRNEKNPLLEEIKENLNNVTGHIYKLKNSLSLGLVWSIAGFIIGYFVAR
jgi:hypothetical protein